MRANLEAARGLPQAEHITALLAPALGRLAAHDLVAEAATRATTNDITLLDAILSDEQSAATLTKAGVTRHDIEAALRPESYLGATPEFIRRALAAHAECEAALHT
jgi:3-carboxy-cis,cis-muconate cycloisomerase